MLDPPTKYREMAGFWCHNSQLPPIQQEQCAANRSDGLARVGKIVDLWCGNDPSAGSPTETLLRLHLPLNDKV